MLFSSGQYWTGTKNSLWNDCTRLGLNYVAKNMQNTSLPRTILYFFFWYVQNFKLRRWAVTCTTSNGEGMVDMYCFNEWFKGRVQVFNFMVFICLSWTFCSILIYMACLHTMQVDWKSIGMFSDAALWNNPFSGIIQCFLKVIRSLSPKLWSEDISVQLDESLENVFDISAKSSLQKPCFRDCGSDTNKFEAFQMLMWYLANI